MENPFNNWATLSKKGAIISDKVTVVDVKGVVVELADGVEGYLYASEVSCGHVEDTTLVLSIDDGAEAKFIGTDHKNRTISLPVCARDEADERDAITTVSKQEDASFSNNTMTETLEAAKGEQYRVF